MLEPNFYTTPSLVRTSVSGFIVSFLPSEVCCPSMQQLGTLSSMGMKYSIAAVRNEAPDLTYKEGLT